MNKDELQAIYFSFYSQLLPEHAEKAKANYDEDFTDEFVPHDHAAAIIKGFDWGEGQEERDHWSEIYGQLNAKTYNLQLTPQVCKDKAVAFMSTERMATKEDFKELDKLIDSIPPVATNSSKEDVLEEALRITGGDRMSDYGPPDQDFRRTAIMWEQLLNGRIVDGKLQLKPQDVATCMIALKLSRQTHQGKRDNWVDVAGYARCGAMCEELES